MNMDWLETLLAMLLFALATGYVMLALLTALSRFVGWPRQRGAQIISTWYFWSAWILSSLLALFPSPISTWIEGLLSTPVAGFVGGTVGYMWILAFPVAGVSAAVHVHANRRWEWYKSLVNDDAGRVLLATIGVAVWVAVSAWLNHENVALL